MEADLGSLIPDSVDYLKWFKINDVTMRLRLSEPMKAERIQNAFHVSLLKPV